MKSAEEWTATWDQGTAELWSADFIAAIQADALEAAAKLCDREAQPAGPLGGSGDSVGEAVAADLAKRIRALIPTAPGTPRPDEPSRTPAHRKHGI